MTAELYAFLKHFHPGLSDDDFGLLASKLQPVQYKKGDTITAPGEIQKHLLFIKKGTQMSFYETGDKLHVIAFTYPPGISAIPESFFNQSPSGYMLQCLTDSEFYRIAFDDLQKLFDRSQALERTFRKITEAVLAGLINRHVELHALSMEERFRAFASRSPHLLQLVQHKYIASYLGINPTNFSKLFNSIRL